MAPTILCSGLVYLVHAFCDPWTRPDAPHHYSTEAVDVPRGQREDQVAQQYNHSCHYRCVAISHPFEYVWGEEEGSHKSEPAWVKGNVARFHICLQTAK